MTDHDQLIKSVIKNFFKEYLDLFFPDLASACNLDSPQFQSRFLDKEHSRTFPRAPRTVDILARVWTIEERFRDHPFSQRTAETTRRIPTRRFMPFPDRMFCYSLLLQLRHFPEHVVPIVLWFVPGQGGHRCRDLD